MLANVLAVLDTLGRVSISAKSPKSNGHRMAACPCARLSINSWRCTNKALFEWNAWTFTSGTQGSRAYPRPRRTKVVIPCVETTDGASEGLCCYALFGSCF